MMTRLLLSLAACALILSASEAAAQKQAAATSDYRLTMPVLRKALPALYAAGKERCTSRQRSPQEIDEMTVAQMEAELEGCAPVQRAAAAHGITTRELAQVSKALLQAGHRLAEEESAKATGGTAAPLPAGALRDNVALVRENEVELGRLIKEQQP
jgi:hypothetical protein